MNVIYSADGGKYWQSCKTWQHPGLRGEIAGWWLSVPWRQCDEMEAVFWLGRYFHCNVSSLTLALAGCNYAVLGQVCQDWPVELETVQLWVYNIKHCWVASSHIEQHSPILDMCLSLSITTCPPGLQTLQIQFPNVLYWFPQASIYLTRLAFIIS